MPRTREELEALPGVGRKTANVVLNIAFGEPTIAVDTHIFRVGNRTGLATGKDPFEVEQKLMQAVPEQIQAARPSLADPARPLCLRRAPAFVREMHHRRFVQMAWEDDAAGAGSLGARKNTISGREGRREDGQGRRDDYSLFRIMFFQEFGPEILRRSGNVWPALWRKVHQIPIRPHRVDMIRRSVSVPQK